MKKQFNNNTQSLLKRSINAGVLTAAIGGLGRLSGKNLSKAASLGLFIGALGVQSFITTQAYAVSESDIRSYAAAMNAAANNQNIAQISQLIADDAIISLSRNNKSSSLDKEGYLQLLQKSWAKASGYRYEISVSNIVAAGNQARAQVTTTETWTQDGKKVTLKTSSRATFSQVGNKTVLLRSVAQVTVD